MKESDTEIKKILVVEDEPVISDVCRRVLTGDGLEVDIAANGKVAQGMIGENRYDCCLIDVRTPAMNGKELYQWLQKRSPRLASAVIFTTGDVMSGDTKGFLEQSGRLFLPKPFTPGDLRAIVKEALRQGEN